MGRGKMTILGHLKKILSDPLLQVMRRSWSIRHIFNFMFGMLLLCHWNGCIQFLIAFLEGFPPNSWVVLNNLEVTIISDIVSS